MPTAVQTHQLSVMEDVDSPIHIQGQKMVSQEEAVQTLIASQTAIQTQAKIQI